jgi:redox-sensing transcriptional repressor
LGQHGLRSQPVRSACHRAQKTARDISVVWAVSAPRAVIRRRVILDTEDVCRQVSQIGPDLKFVPVQVRKDLQFTGVIGKPKIGYSVAELVVAIESFLGWDIVKEAILVGVGHLGTAILGHERFSQVGLQVVAAFDVDPAKVGQTIHGRTVLALLGLIDIVPQMGIHIGIITTPAEVAQGVADEMVRTGIQAIWNFAPVKLTVPRI